MTRRTEAEIDQRLAATATEYVEEEQAAAEEEAAEGRQLHRTKSRSRVGFDHKPD